MILISRPCSLPWSTQVLVIGLHDNLSSESVELTFFWRNATKIYENLNLHELVSNLIEHIYYRRFKVIMSVQIVPLLFCLLDSQNNISSGKSNIATRVCLWTLKSHKILMAYKIVPCTSNCCLIKGKILLLLRKSD